MHLLSPVWFYGVDPALHFAGAAIAFLLSFYFHKIYALSRDKKHMYLHMGFLLLAISSLALTITDTYNYVAFTRCQNEGDCILGYTDNLLSLEDFSYFLYFGLSITAYMLFLFAYWPAGIAFSRLFILAFFIYLFVVPLVLPAPGGSTIGFAYFEYLNLVAFIILAFISFRNAINYAEKKTSGSLFVVFSFGFISLAHLFLLFSSLNGLMYMLYHISLLIGFGSLLMMVLTAENKARYKSEGG